MPDTMSGLLEEAEQHLADAPNAQAREVAARIRKLLAQIKVQRAAKAKPAEAKANKAAARGLRWLDT